MNWIWSRIHRSRRDEKGAVLVIAIAGVLLATIAAALAVDLGRIAAEKRTDQKIADLAALDAVRSLPGDPTNAARTSATRNGFATASFLSAEPGSMVSGTFVPGPSGQPADAVRVTVRSPVSNAFITGQRTVTAVGIASVKEQAGFSIGSKLAAASLDNAVTNRILGGLVGGNVNILSYDGIAAATVELDELRSQLGFGTVSELLNANLTLGQLLSATSTILNNQGVLAAADVNSIAANVTNTSTFKLGDMIEVAQGAEGAAAKTKLNVLQMISGAAELANGTNFAAGCLNVTGLPNVAVPGIGNLGTTLCFKVIEPPKIYVGPEGGFVDTSQVELTFTPTFNVGVNVLSLPLITVSGSLPTKITAAGARGTLTRIECSGPQAGISVRVDPQPFSSSVAAPNLTASALFASASFTGTGSTSSVTAGPTTLDFSYPSEFSPTAPSKSTPQTPLNLSSMTSGPGGNLSIGLISVPIPLLTNAVFVAIAPLFAAVEARVVLPALKALGVTVGSADVAALKDAFDPATCGSPTLVG